MLNLSFCFSGFFEVVENDE